MEPADSSYSLVPCQAGNREFLSSLKSFENFLLPSRCADLNPWKPEPQENCLNWVLTKSYDNILKVIKYPFAYMSLNLYNICYIQHINIIIL